MVTTSTLAINTDSSHFLLLFLVCAGNKWFRGQVSSDNADLGFQAVGPALHIMQYIVEG